MMNNKSIDGLAPKRPVKTISTSVLQRSTPTTTVKRHTITVTAAPSTPPRSHTAAKPAAAPRATAKATSTEPPRHRHISRDELAADFVAPTRAFDLLDDNQPEDTMHEPDTAPTSAPKSKKHKSSRGRRIAIIIVCIIIFLLTAGVVCFTLWGNDIVARITGGRGNIMDLIFETYEPLRTDANDRINILAFGTSGYDMAGTENGQIHDGAQLTDSILIISIDPGTGDTVTASLPRDLKASPTCTSTGKINEVYWCNNLNGDDEETGATALMTEVSNVTGLEFEYYAHINWGSLKSIVDALGGIKVTLDEDINDTEYTKAIYKAGVEYEIDGEQAVMLARARHGTADGDFTRGASQQKILIGIKDRVLEEHLSVGDLINLAAALGDNLRTNFSVSEMKTLAHLSSTLDFSNIRQLSLLEPERIVTTGMINGISYVLPSAGDGNFRDMKAYFTTFIANDPRQEEDASILVLNATERTGVAASEKSDLASSGFQTVDIDNYPSDTFSAPYTLFALTEDAPATQAALEEKYNVTAKSASALPEDIRGDYSFVLIIGSE